ncbi:hypothetical protein BDQ17DRAFT_1411673 [Cyathus striatus]|nr:hypothetical protein BDQ17DRAFT_1411673 [Cyathus striatus]
MSSQRKKRASKSSAKKVVTESQPSRTPVADVVYQLSQSATFFTGGPKRTTEVALPDLYEASVLELQDGLDKGLFTSVDLVKAYFTRIEEVNLKGPALHAVLETNPNALATAALLNKEHKEKGK